MTPELRKEASELQLHKRGIRINVQLHVIEADEEITLRTPAELAQRLLALWSVSHAARDGKKSAIAAYLHKHQLSSYLSNEEAAFFSRSSLSIEDEVTFLGRMHALQFLGWCAGVVDNINLGNRPLDCQKLDNFFSKLLVTDQQPDLISHLKLRRKSSIMDWSDLLYRLHWAVRHAALTNKPIPGKMDAIMVREWHQAVNWMCCYDDENDWDKVSTETSA